jgi:hypothetical protein
VAHVDHLDEAGAPKIVLFRRWLLGLHIIARNCRVSASTVSNPALSYQQNVSGG